MAKGEEISRREFLFGATAAVSLASGGSSRKGEPRLDPNRVAIIADEHIPLPVKVPEEGRPKVWDAILQDRIGLKAVFPL